jgi:hypothetical protein
MRYLLITAVLICSRFSFAQFQNLELKHANAQVFYDYFDKTFYVLDDSSFIWKYDIENKNWIQQAISLELETSFDSFLANYVVLTANQSPTFFVYRGCGEVYQKKGARIFRHDKSFKHENQFDGSFFIYKGSPHVYAGYGLFTAKNILTRYDVSIGEWYMADAAGEFPPSGCSNLIAYDNNNLVVFDGHKILYNKFWKTLNGVYGYNFKTGTWKYKGLFNYKFKGSKNEMPLPHQSFSESSLICYGDYFVDFNLSTLTYSKYKLFTQFLYRKILRANDIVLVVKNTSKQKRIVQIFDTNFFKLFPVEHGNMILPVSKLNDELFANNSRVSQFLFFLLLIIILVFALILFRRKNTLSLEKSIKPTNPLDDINLNFAEKELIKLLLKSSNGLEISFINDLVNYDNPSLDTLKKRREILLRELKIKLALVFNISESEILIEQRMVTDKRMKLIFLNPEILNRLTNIVDFE